MLKQMYQLPENKEEDIVNKSTLVRLRECYWNQRFSNYQKGIPITIES